MADTATFSDEITLLDLDFDPELPCDWGGDGKCGAPATHIARWRMGCFHRGEMMVCPWHANVIISQNKRASQGWVCSVDNQHAELIDIKPIKE